jgi:hypothetical protein
VKKFTWIGGEHRFGPAASDAWYSFRRKLGVLATKRPPGASARRAAVR